MEPQERLVALGKRLFALKEKRDALTEELKSINKQIEMVSTQELAAAMAEAEVDKYTIKGLGTIYLRPEFFCGVLAENREELYAWLRANGHESLIKDWVFPQTLKAFAKELLERNEPLPPLVNAKFIPTAATRSSNG